MNRRDFTQFAGLSLLGIPAYAQSPGGKSVLRWIVPYMAGGGSDFLARKVGQIAQEATNRTVIVENKPGANGAIAISELTRLPADGHTVMNMDNGVMVFNPALYRSLSYVPQRDLIPVAMLTRARLLLMVPASSGITDVHDLIARIKAQPGKVAYASSGAGSPQHLAMEMFKKVAGLEVVHAPYRGSAPAVADLAGGQVLVMMADYMAARAFIQSGKVRPLAVAHTARVPYLPDVPTLKELKLEGAEAAAWLGVAVRSGTPRAAVTELHGMITKALANPDLRKQLDDMGFEIADLSPDEFRDLIDDETRRWHKLIKDLDIKLD